MLSLSVVQRSVLVVLLALGAAGVAFAQSCPTENSQGPHDAPDSSVLHGTLIHHDELRTWLGLKLDQPACGETEIQLIFDTPEAWRIADALRTCAVTAAGKLYLSPTAYYSARLAVANPALKADASCHPFPVEPDPARHPISAGLRSYSVSLTIDTRGKGHTAVRVWQGSAQRTSLQPWEAYANFSLNGGGDVLWFGCSSGFEATDVVQVPKFSGDITRVGSSLGVGLQVDRVNTIAFVCRRIAPSN